LIDRILGAKRHQVGAGSGGSQTKCTPRKSSPRFNLSRFTLHIPHLIFFTIYEFLILILIALITSKVKEHLYVDVYGPSFAL
jgi:hypothetical protein